MFGGKKEKSRLVGAKEKIAKAKERHKNADYNIISKREGKESGPLVSIIIVYSFAIVLTVLFMEGPFKTGMNFKTGILAFDRFFFGSAIPSITGTSEFDYGIVVALRAVLMSLVAGILPFTTFLWQRILDKSGVNPYYAFWGTTIGLPTIFFLIRDNLGPIFMELYDLLLA